MTFPFRTILSLLLCGSVAVSSLSISVAASTETDASSYQEIATKADLDHVRRNLSGKYRLTADIAFSPEDFEPGGIFYNEGAGWLPIGSTYSERFTGELDGNGHTISGLTVTPIASGSGNSIYAGLFGYSSGTIRRLNLIDTTISVLSAGGQSFVYIGGIIGTGTGTLQSCSVENLQATLRDPGATGKVGGITGRMFSGSITDCSVSGSINATCSYLWIGGITGQNTATITGVYSHAALTANGSGDVYAGGITGTNEKTIRTSLADGAMHITSSSDGNTGGIAGWNQATITASLAVGKQTRQILKHDNYGGVCGVGSGGGTGTITASYFALDALPDKEIPAVSGATGLARDQLSDATRFAEWNFKTDWCIGLLADTPYPLPQAFVRYRLRQDIGLSLENIPSIDGAQYTSVSLNNLRTAIKDARSLAENASANAYADALAALMDAQNNLTEKALTCSTQGDGQVRISGENRYGERVTLSATADSGSQFVGFVVHGQFYPDTSVEATVSGGEHATAYFRPENACAVVFRGKYGKVLKVQTVTSAADLIPPPAEQLQGYAFTGWNTALTQLDLSAGCVGVDAVYTADASAPAYTLTLTDTVTAQPVDHPLAFDTRVDLTPSPKEGKVFSHWLVNGSIAGSSPAYTLYVAGNDTIQAVYADTVASLQPTVSLQQTTLTPTADGYTLSVIGQAYTPDNTAVVEYGMLFGADSLCTNNPDSFVLGSLDYATQTITSSSVSPNRRYLIHLWKIPASSTRYVRAYMVVRMANGQQTTLYSPVITVTVPT